jgi:2-keto-3-deoxy-L-rhamnonate aldolase RhmA
MTLTVRNPARERLEKGELALGIGIRLARTVDIAKIMKSCGYDWLFLDLEHGVMGLDTAVQMAVAALDVGIAPLVRVPFGQHWLATRALDGGALGIVMPHVDTAEDAAELVAHLKYPPLGHRSSGGNFPQFDFRAVDGCEATRALNAANLVVAMLETPRAIENAEKIAAVPGIDVLLIGTNDLTLEMGIPGKLGDERVAAAYQAVIAACGKHGKHPGMGGVYAEDLLARYIKLGMRMILGGADQGMMMAAAAARANSLRRCV